jgi:hypothetical protein
MQQQPIDSHAIFPPLLDSFSSSLMIWQRSVIHSKILKAKQTMKAEGAIAIKKERRATSLL